MRALSLPAIVVAALLVPLERTAAGVGIKKGHVSTVVVGIVVD